MRKILFIDEFGDTGVLNPASSDYFGLCCIEIEIKNFPLIMKESNSFRYWNQFNQELKKLRKQQYDVFLEMIEKLIELKLLKFTVGYFHKTSYQGPYYKGKHHNSKKLRNFSIRMLLEQHFSLNPILEQTEVELVFDRFDISPEYKNNLESYLKNNKNLPNIVDIVQIDSIVCEGVQIADFLSKVIKIKTDDFNDIRIFKDFIFEIKGHF